MNSFMSEKIALFDETLLTESMLHLSANVLKVNKSVSQYI